MKLANFFKELFHKWSALKTQRSQPVEETPRLLPYKVVSVSFGNSEKTYDYLLINKSGQRVVKDQQVKVVTGTHDYNLLNIRHLNRYESVPEHVTKQLTLTSIDSGVIVRLIRR